MIEVRSCNTMYASPRTGPRAPPESKQLISYPGSRDSFHHYAGAAVCHESSKHAGDAVCAFNGTGYSIDGEISHIPETTLCGTWESPLFALKRNCNGGSPSRTQGAIDAVHVSETPRLKRDVNTLLQSPASLDGRVCSLPYNPWNLGDCVDGTAVTAVPVLQVVVSDGAERQRVSASSGHGVVSASPSRTSSIGVVPSAVSSAGPAASSWSVSLGGVAATDAVNVGSGRSMVFDGACWSMLLLVSLRVVGHVLLMLEWA
ncbi:hypothetical protein Asppvi_001501 [Aspergillus pseudoviridinutans]|uniref:Uncharacterized protein n=1 Tax=Aspergillus pseudoviridinutans TaxID=1517512 RepID=A0A9P3B418_9EURO|nr:uncharacterized protein Asppvi_001501 [Aspergillus pseudoviridinutans]GIJ82984.1 hypothetical protein Asppvi_001501 [Aspergillus pseudoviridinutans]